MTCLDIASGQLRRQTILQPRLLLPAGRVVSNEEGRRLAKLIEEADERVLSTDSPMKGTSSSSTMPIEESVSRRIVLMASSQSSKAKNKTSAVCIKRRRQAGATKTADSESVLRIANSLR